MSTTTTTEPTKVTVGVHIVPRLPPEIWLLIIRFATSAPIISPFEFAYHYEPFRSRNHEITTALFDATLHDKCAIMSVCKQWHALVGDIRYEDIRIGRHIRTLYPVLKGPAPVVGEPGAGTTCITARHYVRRAVLPYAHAEKPTYHAPSALALLALLPHLEVLVRPPLIMPAPSRRQRRLPIPIPIVSALTATPDLSSLRRLEWGFEDESGKSGTRGVNFLYDILTAASSLHELVLTGPMPVSPHRIRLHLPALRTLRLHDGAGECWSITEQMSYWELQVLENVVVEGRGSTMPLRALWNTFGEQLRMLELELRGGGWGDVSIGDVRKIVAVCPALEELNLEVGVEEYVNWTPKHVDDIIWSCTHNTLQRIGICVYDLECSVRTWTNIVDYTGKFVEGCPALGKVLLYVFDVEVASGNPRFHAFREALLSSGRQLFLHSVHKRYL